MRSRICLARFVPIPLLSPAAVRLARSVLLTHTVDQQYLEDLYDSITTNEIKMTPDNIRDLDHSSGTQRALMECWRCSFSTEVFIYLRNC